MGTFLEHDLIKYDYKYKNLFQEKLKTLKKINYQILNMKIL